MVDETVRSAVVGYGRNRLGSPIYTGSLREGLLSYSLENIKRSKVYDVTRRGCRASVGGGVAGMTQLRT